MWIFLRHLFQLILAPSKGWEDLSACALSYDRIQRFGLFPLIGVMALSEYARLFYSTDLSFLQATGSAIAVGGGMFAAIYASRLFLDITLTRFISEKINILKINNLVTYMLGLDCLYRIFSNLMPASMTFLMFLPLISIIVLFKSTAYLYVSDEQTINYLVLTFSGVVLIPFAVCALLMLII